MSDPQPEKTPTIGLPGSAGAYVQTEAQLDAPGSRPQLPTGYRYVLHEPIARGGMGVVYRATDTTLGREVAVKVLQDRFSGSSAAAQRFVDEARIAGQLQHPGIPAVHDLGVLPDGRPFLAMKLVKGRTLSELLNERSSPVEGRGKFVAVFEALCQAVGYAHAHSVIHRDLKPDNIMVGAFGEVQVMDWGLAKVLGRDEPQPARPEPSAVTEIRMLRESDGSQTQAGSVMGTPAFMPPEQAIGAIDRIDARSDVFGLGGILCVILTGQPPFVADTAEATRQLAALAKLNEAFANLDACGADPDLVALCKRCLSADPNNRPGDAGAVARAVADLRAAADERARQAELERARAEAATQEQVHRRRVQLALMVALGLLLAGAGAFAWWQNEQTRAGRERLVRNAEAAAALLDQCVAALQAGDAAKAEVALEAARKRAAEGGAADLAGRLEQCRADLAVLFDLDAIDLFRSTPVENQWPDREAVVGRYRAALEKFGIDPEAMAADEAAARLGRSAVQARLVATLDLWLWEEPREWVRAVLRRADPDTERDAIRDAVLARGKGKVIELVARPTVAEQPAEFVAVLGRGDVIPVERRRELLLIAVRRRPNDLGLIMALGHTYPTGQRVGAEERARWFQAAVGIAPQNASTHGSLGNALRDLGDLDGALTEAQEAARLAPGFPLSHSGVGVLLRDKGDLDGAIAKFQKAIHIDRDFAPAHGNLGYAWVGKGEMDKAVAEIKEALRLDPENAKGQARLAQVEQLRELLPRLADVCAGQDTPRTPAEGCRFAELCGLPFQKRYATATRLYEKAFAADPKQAEDLATENRYSAACFAALAAQGQGADAALLKPAERNALRQKALDWLRADLALYRKQSSSTDAAPRQMVAETLTHWLRDQDLASTRPAARRDGWSADEVTAWNRLWADVRAVLEDASQPPSPAHPE
jgi:tetratricopeptide (TPR) repeat protein